MPMFCSSLWDLRPFSYEAVLDISWRVLYTNRPGMEQVEPYYLDLLVVNILPNGELQ